MSWFGGIFVMLFFFVVVGAAVIRVRDALGHMTEFDVDLQEESHEDSI